MKDYPDLHTHTIATGHAYGTITEMVHAAALKDLPILGITEHAPSMPGSCGEMQFCNFKVIPPLFCYCSRLAQTVTDFADASHSRSAKSTTATVLYGIFSSENSYPCTVITMHILS